MSHNAHQCNSIQKDCFDMIEITSEDGKLVMRRHKPWVNPILEQEAKNQERSKAKEKEKTD